MSETFSHWAAMGGFAAYVWSAYAVAFAILFALAVAQMCRLKQAQRRLREAEELRGDAAGS